MQEALVEKLSKLENVITRFNDVIEQDADAFRKEYGIISAEAMQEHLAKLTEENRLLNIGIIGRVKAGKSSLLNSIFFNGESVLPKAATPMTASLTVMTYGDNFSATVEYFTLQEIETIRKWHSSYKADWDEKYEEKKKEVKERAKKRGEDPDMEKVRRSIDTDMKNHRNFASFDQYERMQESGPAPTETRQSINANSLPELIGKLDEYVGSSGKMMPYSKSVEIQIPTDALLDICVVDTPGINDPVKSREARTEEYLKKCDVVFIISPAGQFISKEDTDLMDRLTSKEGVREMYLVASQADGQFYGSIGEQTNFNLNKAVEKLCVNLSSHAKSTLSNLKYNHPEVAGQFDQLINGGKDRVIITSAICHAMQLNYDKQNTWDKDMNHVWGLLNQYYRDYFDSDKSAETNLALLSGVEKVSSKIELARKEKDKIISQKQADYINRQAKNIDVFLKELVKAAKARSDMVKNTDMVSIAAQKKNIEIFISKGTEAIDGTFDDCVDDFKLNVRKEVTVKSTDLFNAVKGQFGAAEGSRIATWTTRGGFFWLFKTHHSREVRTFRTGKVKSDLNDLVHDLKNSLIISAEAAKIEWKKTVQSKVTHALKDAVEDVELINIPLLKTVLRQLVNNLELPNLDLGSNTFTSSYSGTIEEDYNIDRFMDEVERFMLDLRNVFNTAMDEFLSTMDNLAKREKVSAMLFSNFNKNLDSLEKDIQNKKLTLDRLKECTTALEKIS